MGNPFELPVRIHLDTLKEASVKRLMMLAFVTALVAVGCSKTSTPSSSSEPSATPEASAMASSAPVTLSGTVNNHGTKDIAMATTLELEQDNFYFNPTFVKAEPGAKLTVMLKNEGKVPHNFTIDSLHVNETLQPDTKKTVTITLPSSGTVPFYCSFHKSQGMQGAIFFTAGGSAPASTSSGSSGY